MSKFIKLALINISAALLLTACGPSEKDAQQAGFTSVAEMKDLQAKGFKTKKQYEDKLAKDNEDKLANDKKIEEERMALQQVEILRETLTKKVKSCGWKSPPESGKFLLGMTLPEAQRFGVANSSPLSCRNSSSATDILDFMVMAGEKRYAYQSSDLCTTKVDGNFISLHFFKLSNDSEPILGNINNSLDSYNSKWSDEELKPLVEAYSTKFGFNVTNDTYCSIDSGNGYKNNFELYISLPGLRNPLNFTVKDNTVIRLGGDYIRNIDKIQKQKDEQTERENLKKNSSKL